MILVVTCIKLKSPLHFFALANNARLILNQLKKTQYAGFKKKGFWTTHYTISLWNNESDMKAFASSGAHLKAMQQSAKIAKEIRTATVNYTEMPSWEVALKLLENGKVFLYD